jgi:hypothetical protein
VDLAAAGLPDLVADIAIGINRGVEAGAQDRVTSELEAIVGHPPRTVAEFVRDHRDAFMR